MFEGGVENTSGIEMHEFFPELIEHFANLTLKGWGVYIFGMFAFWFLREGIPLVLIKMGVKGLREEPDEN
jgi:hypothetical protein